MIAVASEREQNYDYDRLTEVERENLCQRIRIEDNIGPEVSNKKIYYEYIIH